MPASLFSVLAAAAALAQPPKSPPAKSPPPGAQLLSAWVHERTVSTLKALDDGGDLAKARAEFAALFATAAAYAPANEPGVFVEPDAWLRLCGQLAAADKSSQRALLTYLRAHEPLARELAMALRQQDSPARVYAVLARLIAKDGPKVADYPALAAAICVVHDTPRTAAASRGLKDRQTIDPVALFDYYIANEGRMLLGLKDLPVEALVYMVDTQAAIPELEWALNDHAGDRNVGKRYGDLTYDTAAYKYDQPKKISKLPYTLENLRKVGGVCEEQAYYAAHVARAIGVPGAVISGRSSTDGHVWVGFLQQRGNALAWNMNEGHYDEFEKLRGTVTDPQTGREISDDELALTADLCALPAERRLQAAALGDAAAALVAAKAAPDAPPGVPGLRSQPRQGGLASALELLDAARAIAPTSPAVWSAVTRVAPSMDAKARTAWFANLSAACGRKYPTFAYSVLKQMIRGIEDHEEQSRMWDWAFREYRTRADLASDARLCQGRMWREAGDSARAYEAFLDVSRNFSNDGTAVVEALQTAEQLLVDSGKVQAVPDMYADAFRRITRPSNTSPGFFASTNYYRVGDLYAKSLDRLHRDADAANVRRLIDRGVSKQK